MSLHDLLGLHKPDLMASRWDEGRFMSRCVACGRPMVKPPGGTWIIFKPERP
jgi:hypothetical protein